jgi:hypothetical protein
MSRRGIDRRQFFTRAVGCTAGGLVLAANQVTWSQEKESAIPPQPVLRKPPETTLKFLFLDNRGYEFVEGCRRELQQPRKCGANPLLKPDRPWEHGNITLYGSVVQRPGGPFQLWYSVVEPPWHMMLAYAESDDGLEWRKPELDVYRHEGRKTNIVFTDHPHGPAVIYDDRDPREGWKYKMLCGASPSKCICAYHSADGIRWKAVRGEPVIDNRPDCPMALLRRSDGVYEAYHRIAKLDRRVGRSESTDFVHWTGRSVVLEPGPGDPTQLEFYGMGVTPYGDLEMGALWVYRTDYTGRGTRDGVYDPELSYSRNGVCWHRAAPGQVFLPRGEPTAWDSGNLQCTSSAVLLPKEIRYYYASSNLRHAYHWEVMTPGGRFGVGMASLEPDRFMALTAGDAPAMIHTVRFILNTPEIFLNADVLPEGEVRMELLDSEGTPIPGFELDHCLPLRGNSVEHSVRWEGRGNLSELAGKPIRWRLRATNAKLYAVWIPGTKDKKPYYQFQTL